MHKCWEKKSKDRPTFAELVSKLQTALDKQCPDKSLIPKLQVIEVEEKHHVVHQQIDRKLETISTTKPTIQPMVRPTIQAGIRPTTKPIIQPTIQPQTQPTAMSYNKKLDGKSGVSDIIKIFSQDDNKVKVQQFFTNDYKIFFFYHYWSQIHFISMKI